MPVNLSQGILPGLQVADQLRNSRLARESQAQENMIKMSNFQKEQAQEQIEANAAQNLIDIMKGNVTDSGAPTTDETDFGSFFQQLGEQMYKAGAPKRGQELLEQSVDFRKKESDINKAEFDMQKTRLESMIKAGNYMFNALGTGGNESEFQHIINSLPEDIVEILGPENVETLKTTPWSPEFQGYLRDRAMSIKDQANLALQERRVDNAETATENARRNAEALRAIGEGRLQEQRRANDLREKAGGTNVGKAATKAELDAADAAIINSVEGLADLVGKEDRPKSVDTALNLAAQDIAGRAKIIVDENRGMTFDTAVGQAIMEAEAAGDFNVIKETISSWLPWKADQEVTSDFKYRRRGTTASNPAPFPSDPSKLVRGRFYERNGKVGQYGTDFE